MIMINGIKNLSKKFDIICFVKLFIIKLYLNNYMTIPQMLNICPDILL